jgi:small subunit ribosomal protein S4
MKGVTGENLLSLLERRLDNVVYRSASRPTARGSSAGPPQSRSTVNGKANIPSMTS